jgi:4-hydroxybenzoate polyprenyltransferase
MQHLDPTQPVFSLTLAAAFIFGVLFASLVRWASGRKMVGQTAFAVIVGVTGTLLIAIPFFGLNIIVLLFPYFIASGLPMIVEYILRVQKEIDQDKQSAKDLAKDLLNDRQTGDR